MEDTSSEIGCSFSSCTDSENAEDVPLDINVSVAYFFLSTLRRKSDYSYDVNS